MPAADFWWLIPSPRDDGSPKANPQISPGITHSPSRLSLSDLRHNVRASTGLCIYWPAHPVVSPLSAGCSSEQRFAYSFLRIPPHGGHPCPSANTSPCRVCRGLTPPSECALPGAPVRKARTRRAFRLTPTKDELHYATPITVQSSLTASALLFNAACSSEVSLISMICSNPFAPSLQGTPT
jgi:hypothetical protein